MLDAVDGVIQGVKWLIGLAKPENLRDLVQAIGPFWVYSVLTAIVFAETGLLIGFFLPGDSLLFACGFLASSGVFNIPLLSLLLIAAAILGDAINYYVGYKMGEHVFEKGHLRFVRHEHLMAAKEFYERHGGMAIVLARFVPLVRTFTPFVAGVAKMNYGKFAFYNISGGIAWVISMTQAGYWLGRIPVIQKNFELTVLVIVFLSVLPVIIGVVKKWLGQRSSRKVSADDNTDSVRLANEPN